MPTGHAIVVGAGLAGLVAAAELLDHGHRVTLLDQEGSAALGGQAWWSFGGLFLVDSPEQRRLGVRDTHELARTDWLGAAAFDRPEDELPRRWAEAYLDFAAGEKRAWLRERGIGFFPVVGWAERARNSVPRFHIVWGTGPALLAPFIDRLHAGVAAGQAEYRPRHRVTELVATNGAITGVRGERLVIDDVARGESSSREATGDFELSADVVLVSSGGIGGNADLVRASWPARLGPAPKEMLSGVPAHVDGLMLGIAARAGARLINGDRMWHYTEGIANHTPVWPAHGIRILPGPSSLWLDATGQRLPSPHYPGFDTLDTLTQLRKTGHDHSWFVTTEKIAGKEFALSGSEQNPDLTGKSVRLLLDRLGSGAPAPVQAFLDRGADFVVADTLEALLDGMQKKSAVPLDRGAIRRAVAERDRGLQGRAAGLHSLGSGSGAAAGSGSAERSGASVGAGADAGSETDEQMDRVRAARGYLGDKLVRVAPPHALTEPTAGPLVAVKLHLLTRKSLGGLHTDLDGRVLGADGDPVPGLYGAGEAAGFGGGGVHGYRALEGTFLGGCLFSGRTAGRAMAAAM